MPTGFSEAVEREAEAVELPADAPETAEFDVPPGHYVSIAVADAPP